MNIVPIKNTPRPDGNKVSVITHKPTPSSPASDLTITSITIKKRSNKTTRSPAVATNGRDMIPKNIEFDTAIIPPTKEDAAGSPTTPVSSPSQKESATTRRLVFRTDDDDLGQVGGSTDQLNARRLRFKAASVAEPARTAAAATSTGSSTSEESGWGERVSLDGDVEPVVGTCAILEKAYFRLYERPDPSTIRPLRVLKQAFQNLAVRQQTHSAPYSYICNQLKAVRQDLMVQHISNEFTVLVYETNARLSLENDDIGEFQQCQMQLIVLYDQLSGAPNFSEFLAYRILTAVLQNSWNDMGSVLQTSKDLMRFPCVRHAVDVLNSVVICDYATFFKLLPQTPNHGKYLMAKIVHELRLHAIEVSLKGYGNKLPIDYVSSQLGFSDSSELTNFCEQNGITIPAVVSSFLPTNQEVQPKPRPQEPAPALIHTTEPASEPIPTPQQTNTTNNNKRKKRKKPKKQQANNNGC